MRIPNKLKHFLYIFIHLLYVTVSFTRDVMTKALEEILLNL